MQFPYLKWLAFAIVLGFFAFSMHTITGFVTVFTIWAIAAYLEWRAYQRGDTDEE